MCHGVHAIEVYPPLRPPGGAAYKQQLVHLSRDADCLPVMCPAAAEEEMGEAGGAVGKGDAEQGTVRPRHVLPCAVMLLRPLWGERGGDGRDGGCPSLGDGGYGGPAATKQVLCAHNAATMLYNVSYFSSAKSECSSIAQFYCPF